MVDAESGQEQHCSLLAEEEAPPMTGAHRPRNDRDDSLRFSRLFDCSSMDDFNKEPASKVVSFNERCRAKYTIHIDDYTDEEYFSCWYTPEELAEMKYNLLETLHRLERNEIVDEITDTFRGLETHTKTGKRDKGRSRTVAIETVVGAYYSHANDGKKLDEHDIAGAYKECNKASELVAYLNALEDQVTARDLDMSFNTESVRQRRGVRRCGFSLVVQ